ncbi:hypothetical protein [Sphingomonas psychrotolerans]|uniref:Uncharacterized protein n=1 Tax=Sphingomonas psychrotolerans TaxID=1327635 RepID=A0A2K8MIT5_9SPHN|nr:hypothetical protein [Sphingomonas psychrotolerans]ATY31659.1 hypothetical protein CVN68_06475 [Sphingomonas psychrotolerans]
MLTPCDGDSAAFSFSDLAACTLGANKLTICNSRVNATFYSNFIKGGSIELQKTGQSSSPLKGVLSSVQTWPATTIAAGANDYLSLTSTGMNDSAVLSAMLVTLNAALVGLRWEVVPVNSDSAHLYAFNTTGSSINIPNGTQVRVVSLQF